jgi:endonuclease G, mitochondrial
MPYDPAFLDPEVATPTPVGDIADDLVTLDGRPQLDYTHFSLALSTSRRLARWVAWNVDGEAFDHADEIGREGIDFKPDERIPEDVQTLDDLYAGNDLDRGHLARRSDLLWGGLEEARQANEDSFFFTNITPQMAGFNQSMAGGKWGELEDALLEQTTAEGLRLCVLAGPVLDADDPTYRGELIPLDFWKAIAYVAEGELRVRAFVLTQNLDGLARRAPAPATIDEVDLSEFDVYAVTLDDLSERTSLAFADPLLDADGAPRAGVSRQAPQRVGSVADISW